MENLITKYPDGSSYATVKGLTTNVGHWRINSYNDLVQLVQIIEAYNHQGITPGIDICSLIDSQADRRFDYTQSFGLKIVTDILKTVDAIYTVFHPHNPDVLQALLPGCRIQSNFIFISEVIKQLDWYSMVDNNTRYDETCYLMSADAGGFKPLMKLCSQLNWAGKTHSASKARVHNANTGRIEMVQQLGRVNFEGADVLIVDDLCIYGNTFKGLARKLRDANVGKIYLAVSHMTVQNLGNDPVTNYFDRVFTTNSKFDGYYCEMDSANDSILPAKNYPDNLTVINLFNVSN